MWRLDFHVSTDGVLALGQCIAGPLGRGTFWRGVFYRRGCGGRVEFDGFSRLCECMTFTKYYNVNERDVGEWYIYLTYI